MPAKPIWLLRIPEILAALEQAPVPFLGRAAFEQLFGVRRRQAINLMRTFGGYQVGKTFLVATSDVVDRLHLINSGADFERETARRLRVETLIEQAYRDLKARQIQITVPTTVRQLQLEGLPSTIRFVPGQLRITFEAPEDLVRQLFELSQAIANNYAEFERVAISKGAGDTR